MGELRHRHRQSTQGGWVSLRRATAWPRAQHPSREGDTNGYHQGYQLVSAPPNTSVPVLTPPRPSPAATAAESGASRCPACAGPLTPWRQARAAEPSLTQSFGLLRCERCGSAVTDGPPLEELHDSGAYASPAPRGATAAAALLRAFDRRRLRLVARALPPPARLLDVGAGRGRFVSSARAAGYEAGGIEPSERGIRAAADAGVELTQATIGDADFAPGSLDVITLWHVLEHVEDPNPALERIARWLRPGGALLVGVPNLASLQARLGGERWYHLDVPRHRTHFTPAGLRTLLRHHGFETQRSSHVLCEHNPFGMWQSLVNRATQTPSWLYNALKRNAALGSPDALVTLLAIPLAPPAALLELAAGIARRGGTIAVLARRVG
ncbi:MAG TPA: class I SAM-dependent methyltransferase [Solirubrobacteraceae bacterium]|nr:class I SAM-dependent methyltransferase [Solirubrobacteraceae bacterium]